MTRLKRLWTDPRALESRLADAVDKVAVTVLGPAAASPLELVDRAADEIARQAQPAGRGRYTFPFTDVCVTLAIADAETQARIDAICVGPPSLRDRVLQRLASAGCHDAAMDVRVAFAAEPGTDWTRPDFHIALSRRPDSAGVPRASVIRLELVVVHGTADRGSYAFTSLPIAIGRGTEVRDHHQHLIRINDIAFIEGGDEVTQSVSRRHARIVGDPTTGRPRVVDDNSARGTSVIRQGRGIVVPRGSRGLGLQSGDEIALGQARILLNLVTT
jgi:hypothetical protein